MTSLEKQEVVSLGGLHVVGTERHVRGHLAHACTAFLQLVNIVFINLSYERLLQEALHLHLHFGRGVGTLHSMYAYHYDSAGITADR